MLLINILTGDEMTLADYNGFTGKEREDSEKIR